MLLPKTIKDLNNIKKNLQSLIDDWKDEIPDEYVDSSLVGHRYKCQISWLNHISASISFLNNVLPQSKKTVGYLLKLDDAVRFIDEYRERSIDQVKGYKVTVAQDIVQGNQLLEYFVNITEQTLSDQ